MGEVYLAHDTRTERRVALKLLPDIFTEDEKRVRRFQQEARAILSLNHPNIVTIFEIGQDSQAHFIATELVEGETLRHRIKHDTLKLKDALDVAAQVSRALAAAHEAGIIHRDIKPENIMIRADGYVKVLDFGLAKLVEKSASSDSVDTKAATVMRVSTDMGVVMGTVDYMSPEQARALPIDERTDVWSVGVVLYEMVTGRRPFEGATKTDVIAALLEHEPPPLARYLPETPSELQRIVTKALSKEREERYQTVKDLLIDLKNLQRSLELQAELKRSVHSTEGSSPTAIISAPAEKAAAQSSVEKQSAQTANIAPAKRTSNIESLTGGVASRKTVIIALCLSLLLMGAGVFAFLKYWRAQSKPVESFSKTKVSRLTTNGQANAAAISPDGKYVAHAQGGRGQQSLWLRHIATGSDTQIIPASQADYTTLDFSPDGSYIYFLRWETNENVLYRVPVLGGTMQKLGNDVDAIKLSPDGRQLAMMRGYPPKDEGILSIVNADGTGEQNIITHSQRDMYPAVASVFGPAWSPDGGTIIYALRKDVGGKRYWNLMSVRLKDKAEQQFTNQKWTALGQVAWLPDGSGLVIAAADEESYPSRQIWFVSYPEGSARRITNDTNSYNGISLTGDSTALVTVQTEKNLNVWIAPANDSAKAVQITSNNYDGYYGLTWTPDGRILYTTRIGARSTIWIMNADGSNQKQLTADASNNSRPVVSPDGRYIVFISSRAGNPSLWRMDIDGGNPKQLSEGILAGRPDITPDGKWVVYSDTEGGQARLWKVAIEGGERVPVTNYTSGLACVSPDGKQLVISFIDEQATPRRWRFGIIPVEGGTPAKVFDFNNPFGQWVTWSGDGRSLTYIDTRAGVSNLLSQPVDGGKPTPLTAFKSELIFNYAFSRDRKQLAVARGRETSDVVLINSLK
jgi:serine/threonine protein kinase/Tol biopolymer transport system component